MEASTALSAARRCLEEQDWSGAWELLTLAPADDAEACELRASAAYGLGDLEGCLTWWENQHRVLRNTGDDVGAARAACMVALNLLCDTGLMTPVRAWLRRAEELLENDVVTPPHAMIAMIRTYERFMCGDAVASRSLAGDAIRLGISAGLAPAVMMGRIATARLDILEGKTEQGLGELDEVALELMSGEVDALTAGIAYCELICAAQGMLQSARAQEWTEAMERWRPGRAFGAFHGRCLVHKAELLRVSGPADEAEAVAEKACASLEPWLRREFGWPLAELGAIRLRRGDLDGAEEALLAAHERGWCAMPALALVRLEQGELTTAAALIAEAIARPIEIPWKERPPIGDLRLFPFYAAQVEIAVAAGDRGTAVDAVAALSRIAAAHPGPGVDATAALGRARAALLDDDPDGAVRAAAHAVATWAELDAPFELGQARLVLALAHRSAGNEEAAALERRSAAEAFRSFGVPERAAAIDQGVVPSASGLPRSVSMTLTGKTLEITFGGRTSHLRDLVGLRTLRRLLAEPGREFHVLDLVTPGAGDRTALDGSVSFTVETGLPVLDDQARAAYRRRLTEIEEDIAEAEAGGDRVRLELAEADRDFLAHELGAAVGLGGRGRRTGDPAERARTSVARSLRYALDVLAEHDPALAEHLRLNVRTGVYCSYRPDPLAPIDWQV